MLVLTRRPGEKVVFSHPALPGPITVHVIPLAAHKFKLAIDAPAAVAVTRPDAKKLGPRPAA